MKGCRGKHLHYGYLILAACCAICFSTVTLSFNTAGIFYSPASAELGIGTGTFGTYMTVQYAVMCVSMIFGGKILHRFDARAVLTVCVVMVSVSLMAMSTFTALWQFYLSGACIGAANSILLYLMVPTMIDRWFKERVGSLVGIALCFTGVGAIIFNPVGGFIIDAFGWRTGYLAFGLISACIGLPCAFLIIRDSPAAKGLLRYGENVSDSSVGAPAPVAEAIEGVPYKKALKMPALYLTALYAGMMDVGITINYYLPSYTTSLGYSVIIVSSVASAVMVGQLVGKVLLGYINDRSARAGVLVAITSGIVGIAIMAFLGPVTLIALYVGAVLYGVFFAGSTVTTALMTRSIFGSRDYSRIFSIVAAIAVFCSAFSSALWGGLIEATGSYPIMLYVGLLMMVSIYAAGLLALRLGARVRADVDAGCEKISDSPVGENSAASISEDVLDYE